MPHAQDIGKGLWTGVNLNKEYTLRPHAMGPIVGHDQTVAVCGGF
jgi:hypothetical protein